jgi:hypothetical protein
MSTARAIMPPCLFVLAVRGRVFVNSSRASASERLSTRYECWDTRAACAFERPVYQELTEQE